MLTSVSGNNVPQLKSTELLPRLILDSIKCFSEFRLKISSLENNFHCTDHELRSIILDYFKKTEELLKSIESSVEKVMKNYKKDQTNLNELSQNINTILDNFDIKSYTICKMVCEKWNKSERKSATEIFKEITTLLSLFKTKFNKCFSLENACIGAKIHYEQTLLKNNSEMQKLLDNIKNLITDQFSMQNYLRPQSIPMSKPSCFISYAWPQKEFEEDWTKKFIKRFSKDLNQAGVYTILDQVNSRFGENSISYMRNIEECDFILLIGTYSLKSKWDSKISFHAVKNEINLIKNRVEIDRKKSHKNKVFPILLNGTINTSFPADFKGHVVIESFENGYLNLMKQLLQTIYLSSEGASKEQYKTVWQPYEKFKEDIENKVSSHFEIKQEKTPELVIMDLNSSSKISKNTSRSSGIERQDLKLSKDNESIQDIIFNFNADEFQKELEFIKYFNTLSFALKEQERIELLKKKYSELFNEELSEDVLSKVVDNAKSDFLYQEKGETHYLTVGDGNCFFHAAFGQQKNGIFLTDNAQQIREQWCQFLGQFSSLADTEMPTLIRGSIQKVMQIFFENLKSAPKDFQTTEIKQLRKETKQRLDQASENSQSLARKVFEKLVKKPVKYKTKLQLLLDDLEPSSAIYLGIQSFLKQISPINSNDETIKNLINKLRENEQNIKNKLLANPEKYKETHDKREFNSKEIQLKFINNEQVYKAYLESIKSLSYYVFIEEIPILAALNNIEVTVWYKEQQGYYKNNKFEPNKTLIDWINSNQNKFRFHQTQASISPSKVEIFHAGFTLKGTSAGAHYSRANGEKLRDLGANFTIIEQNKTKEKITIISPESDYFARSLDYIKEPETQRLDITEIKTIRTFLPAFENSVNRNLLLNPEATSSASNTMVEENYFPAEMDYKIPQIPCSILSESTTNKINPYYYNIDSSRYEPKATEWLNKAKMNDPNAQFHIGSCYYSGTHGVSQDYKAAVFWYEKAAEQKLPEAQNNLGNCYKKGERGVSKDFKKALELFQLSANSGYAPAQFNLAACYQEIAATCKEESEKTSNFEKAVHWYTKAAEQNHLDAKYYLGLSYEKGFGVKVDNQKAIELYRDAEQQGHQPSIKRLETLRDRGLKYKF